MRSPLLAATALIACFALPAQALDLGGRDRAGGGSNGSAKAGVGVSIDRNGVGASIGKTDARVSLGNQDGIQPDAAVLGRNDGLSNGGRSTPVDAIHARLEALSDRELVELCLEIEGPSDCADGDQSTELLHVIELGLNKLSEKELNALCSELDGKGCESHEPPVPGPSGPVPGIGTKESDVTRQLDSDERAALDRRCVGVLKRPRQYDPELLNLCILMRRI
jgi:hypothetical protein